MKLKSIEIDTDQGRRIIQISPPIDVDPTGAMPPHFRSLTEHVWDVIRHVALHGSELAAGAPKAEA